MEKKMGKEGEGGKIDEAIKERRRRKKKGFCIVRSFIKYKTAHKNKSVFLKKTKA